ncbi:unnamed protein product, partial [Clonostachys solani]
FGIFYQILALFRRVEKTIRVDTYCCPWKAWQRVRLGPKAVSKSDPGYVTHLNGIIWGGSKLPFHITVQQTINKSRVPILNLFTSQDDTFHSKIFGAARNAHAMSTLVLLSPLSDKYHFLTNQSLKNPGLSSSTSPVAVFTRNRMLGRADPENLGDKEFGEVKAWRDFLSRFPEAHQKYSEFISNDRVLALTVANMLAGSDTIAITLRANFDYLMKNPADMSALLNNLSQEEDAGNFTREDGLLGWNQVRSLPCLNAVIKEALRCTLLKTRIKILKGRGRLDFHAKGSFIYWLSHLSHKYPRGKRLKGFVLQSGTVQRYHQQQFNPGFSATG